jgi:hypothetical protein
VITLSKMRQDRAHKHIIQMTSNVMRLPFTVAL